MAWVESIQLSLTNTISFNLVPLIIISASTVCFQVFINIKALPVD